MRITSPGEGVSTAVRRELRAGDLEAILDHHARLYPSEYGVDGGFVAHVADAIAMVSERGFPRDREGLWIVERDGRHAGSTALTDEGDGVAIVRWVLLGPEVRGLGIGRRIIGEAVAEARDAGFGLVRLDTFSDLTAAAGIYRSLGFEVVSEDTRPRWGRPSITYQRYELDLARQRAISSRSTS